MDTLGAFRKISTEYPLDLSLVLPREMVGKHERTLRTKRPLAHVPLADPATKEHQLMSDRNGKQNKRSSQTRNEILGLRKLTQKRRLEPDDDRDGGSKLARPSAEIGQAFLGRLVTILGVLRPHHNRLGIHGRRRLLL